MKKLVLLCLFVSMSVAAEPFPSQKPVMCDAQETILESLANNYSEKPVWMGRDLRNDNMYILTANEKEDSWTYLETNGKVACVLGAGTKHTPMFGEKI